MHTLNLRNIRSSYSDNNYGDVFYYLIKSFKPKNIVELGTYYGYSALHIAKALSEQDYNSKFTIIDLWDRYLYNHCDKVITINNFKKNKLLDINNVNLNFIQNDALKCYKDFDNNSIDFIHIDISNNGYILEKCLEKWHEKIKLLGVLLFEGGSEERDYVDWMIRYKKTHIRNFIDSAFFITHYNYIILKPFPSLTIAMKIKL